MNANDVRAVAEGSLPRPTACRALSHAARRALVDSLDGRRTGLALADAAAAVASRLDGCSAQTPAPGRVEEVCTALHHVHVPKLVDAGLLAHDRGRNVISLTERGRDVARRTDLTAADGDAGVASPW